jgi:hypothetical protein
MLILRGGLTKGDKAEHQARHEADAQCTNAITRNGVDPHKTIIKEFNAPFTATGSNLTGPHRDARFRCCAINTGAFTEPAFEETQFHRYQPPRIPAILSGRSACFFTRSDLFVPFNGVVCPERIEFTR